MDFIYQFIWNQGVQGLPGELFQLVIQIKTAAVSKASKRQCVPKPAAKPPSNTSPWLSTVINLKVSQNKTDLGLESDLERPWIAPGAPSMVWLLEKPTLESKQIFLQHDLCVCVWVFVCGCACVPGLGGGHWS